MPVAVQAVRLVGQVMVGFWLSVTMTSNVHVVEPLMLVAVAVTVVVPKATLFPVIEYVITGAGMLDEEAFPERLMVPVHTPESVLMF